MTRLRARGGVRDKPPIIDDDEPEMVLEKKKRRPAKKTVGEREKVDKPVRERVEHTVEKERDITQDESSLYYIVRHSKAAIVVSNCNFYNFSLF